MKMFALRLKQISIKDKIIYKNLSISYGLKLLSIIISFLQIRISLGFLSSSVYGLWLTIVSFTSWISILDLGFGNGMRNKLTEAVAINDITAAKKYLSTGYIIIGSIFIGIIVLVSPLIAFSSLTNILNISLVDAQKIKTSLLIVFISVCIQFILRLINSVYFAYQKASQTDIISFISQLSIFILLLLFGPFIKGSLISFALIFSIVPICVYSFANIYAFLYKYKHLRPSFKYYKNEFVKDIMHTGGQFFVIQFSALILYSTDNILINYFLGPESVTVYSIPFRYFSFSIMCFQILLPPYWSMTIQAAKEKDVQWIKNAAKNLTLIWALSVLISIVMVMVSRVFYKTWIGSSIQIPFSLTVMLMIYSVLNNWAAIFNTLTYGLGKIKVQFYASIASIILNIPVSIFLLKKTSLGLLSLPIVISTYTLIICIITPLYLKKVLAKIKSTVV